MFLGAEEGADPFRGDVALEEGGEQDAQGKPGAGCLHVASQAEEIAQEGIGMGVVSRAFPKALEMEEVPSFATAVEQCAGGEAAQEAGDEAWIPVNA